MNCVTRVNRVINKSFITRQTIKRKWATGSRERGDEYLFATTPTVSENHLVTVCLIIDASKRVMWPNTRRNPLGRHVVPFRTRVERGRGEGKADSETYFWPSVELDLTPLLGRVAHYVQPGLQFVHVHPVVGNVYLVAFLSHGFQLHGRRGVAVASDRLEKEEKQTRSKREKKKQ